MKNYLYLLLIMLIASCATKEEPLEETGMPAFAISGLVDGKMISIKAGKNNYEMETGHVLGRDNVYNFQGELKPKCASCGPSISLSIRNYTVNPAYIIDSAVRPRNFNFYDPAAPDEISYRIYFRSSATGSGQAEHIWNFGSTAVSSNLSAPVVTYQGGKYNVDYTSVFANGCRSVLTQTLNLNPRAAARNMDFNVNYGDTFNLIFNSLPIDAVADITWDFGDSTTGTGTIVQHRYTRTGLYKVCMLYIRDGDTLEYCKNVNTANRISCKANFGYTTEIIIDSLGLSDVIIDWTDTNGKKYSSAGAAQDASGSFKVISAKNYPANAKGEKVKMIEILFSCNVSDGTDVIRLKNMKGTVAVAYP